MNIQTHIEMLKTNIDFRIEQTLRQIKPYDRYRDVDNNGNELRYNPKLNVWESVTFKPFWRSD